MKKIFKYFFILLNLFFLSKSIFGQDCPTVNAEAFPMNPQTGQYNYFGVRVTLGFIYDQDVTVTGYIHAAEDEENNQDHPFSLTVTAGNLTSETDDDFYQTGPTDGASVTVASITPCPFWWESKAANSANPYDTAGLRHNQGIMYCMNLTSGTWIDRTVSYATTLQTGINHDTLVSIANAGAYAAVNDSTNYVPTYMSTTGKNYASQLISLIDNIQETSGIDISMDSVRSLESSIASSALTTNEKAALLSACSVARYSIYYWLENVDSSGVAMSEYNYRFYSNDMNASAFNSLNKYPSGPSVSVEIPNIKNFPFTNNMLFRGGWFKRLLHTVIGDIVGALAGAGFGSLLPGGAATVIFGAIIGGISGSLAANDPDFQMT